jgi:hypothetical protein
VQINQVSGNQAVTRGARLKPCHQCKQKAEWRYKEGWGVLACADWFIGKCEGQPLEVAPPSGVILTRMRPTTNGGRSG